MNLSMRNKLLEKLIGDMDMMDDEGGEQKPKAKLSIMQIDAKPKDDEDPEAEEGQEDEGDLDDADEEDSSGLEALLGGKPEDNAEAKPEDDEQESLGDDGLLPHERLRKLMAKGR